MTPEYRIISLGTLAANPLWDERGPARTGHATTTLISVGDDHILVDPSLPAPALLARLSERTPLKPDAITHVFLTSFERERRRALEAFRHATWLIHEPERAAAQAWLSEQHDEALLSDDRELSRLLDQDLALLSNCDNAPDSIAPKVDLFPLPGVTPGTCGLLLPLPHATVLVCGDAVPTLDHLAQGKVLSSCANLQQAQESFREALEIADVLILGRDNLAMNPLRRI